MLTQGMSHFTLKVSDRLYHGQEGWTVAGAPGWNRYEYSPPSLFNHEPTAEEARALNALVLASPAPIEAMKPFVIKKGEPDYELALRCLTQAIYYEAGFEPIDGQEAVAQVVLNRVRHPAYPNSVCGVVYQGAQRLTGCQFSFTCDGSLARAPAEDAWLRARRVAESALAGQVDAAVGTATHYHADYVFPYWAVTLVKMKQIGAHIFYRMTGPSGRTGDFTARYAGNEAVLSEAILTGGDTRTPDAPSALADGLSPVGGPPQTVTLNAGGEARTYTIAAIVPMNPVVAVDLNAPGRAAAQNGAADPATVAIPAAGIRPSRRMPSPEEVKQINDKLMQMQRNNEVPLIQ